MKIFFGENNQGQSLIEVLVAVLILSLVLTATSLMATKSIQLSQASSFREKAITLAKNEIENVIKDRDSKAWSAFVSGISTENKEIGEYVVSKTVGKHDDDSDSSIDRVEVVVEVSWDDFKGNHSVDRKVNITDWKQ